MPAVRIACRASAGPAGRCCQRTISQVRDQIEPRASAAPAVAAPAVAGNVAALSLPAAGKLGPAAGMPAYYPIHDFYGFPPELFEVQYPAPGLPEMAAEVSDVVHPTWVGADVDSWGIDHGTWSVLVHAFPDASIPVVQLSINADKPLDYHLELGAKLAPLRNRGVLVVASGNVVHNLRGMDWKLADEGYDWARRFDEDARARMLTDPTGFATLDAHPDYGRAVPTPDHFIPALYLAGLAGATDAPGTEILVDGYAYGSLSMTAYTLGLSCPATPAGSGAPRPPADLPPDGSNI
ncbi:dioxygenase [Plantactinospora sp. WMMB782]|uniref:dioxygenase family protein n=1 Tax=Plantactinospora sp. WMMB782 TaxID=3404121 RepID=UPI003B96286C